MKLSKVDLYIFESHNTVYFTYKKIECSVRIKWEDGWILEGLRSYKYDDEGKNINVDLVIDLKELKTSLFPLLKKKGVNFYDHQN
jgi:hypothetical protein